MGKITIFTKYDVISATSTSFAGGFAVTTATAHSYCDYLSAIVDALPDCATGLC